MIFIPSNYQIHGYWSVTLHNGPFRIKDKNALTEMREMAIKIGLTLIEILNLLVFKSCYYQSPGCAIFELPIYGPGYGIAHTAEEKMRKKLFLPSWLEGKHNQIENELTPIKL